MNQSFIEAHSELARILGKSSVGDISLPVGWVELLLAFTLRLKALPPELRSGVYINQIKEKYGTLRIYAYAPDEIFEVTGAAELASNAICGICGRPGSMRGMGWMQVRCDIHAQGHGNRVRRIGSSDRQLKIALEMLGDVFCHPVSKHEFEAIAHVTVTLI